MITAISNSRIDNSKQIGFKGNPSRIKGLIKGAFASKQVGEAIVIISPFEDMVMNITFPLVRNSAKIYGFFYKLFK